MQTNFNQCDCNTCIHSECCKYKKIITDFKNEPRKASTKTELDSCLIIEYKCKYYTSKCSTISTITAPFNINGEPYKSPLTPNAPSIGDPLPWWQRVTCESESNKISD